MQPWPNLTFPVGSEGNLSSYFLQDLSLRDPVCCMPMMHRAKSLEKLKFMNIENLFSSEGMKPPLLLKNTRTYITRFHLTLLHNFCHIQL